MHPGQFSNHYFLVTWLFLAGNLKCLAQQNPSMSSFGLDGTTSTYEENFESLNLENEETQEKIKPRQKTLTFLKELRNITKNAGDQLKLRCEVTGTEPVTSFAWYKNDAPLIEEKNRMKIKNKLNGDLQWSMLKFKVVETLDTAFYECRASNAYDTIKSVAIITVDLGKPGSGNNQNNNNIFEHDDNLGLLPETYSDPDFPGNILVENFTINVIDINI